MRFGFRDYDPRFGRFTAKDPLGDTGGDHDLWDYCVDDPVSMNDPSGLFPPLLLLGLGMLGAGGIAAGGAYGAAAATDHLSRTTRGKSAGAVDAVNKVAPMVGATMAAGATPGAMAFGGPAVAHGLTYAGQRAGAELASRGLDGVARNGFNLPIGAAVPMAATPLSFGGQVVRRREKYTIAENLFFHREKNERTLGSGLVRPSDNHIRAPETDHRPGRQPLGRQYTCLDRLVACLLAPCGFLVLTLALRALLRGKGKEKPPTDEDIMKAKAVLGKIYLKEHGTLPEYPEENSDNDKREQKS